MLSTNQIAEIFVCILLDKKLPKIFQDVFVFDLDLFNLSLEFTVMLKLVFGNQYWFNPIYTGEGRGGGGWWGAIVSPATLNLSNFFNNWENTLKLQDFLRNLSGKICGRLVLTDFDVSTATNFWLVVFFRK